MSCPRAVRAALVLACSALGPAAPAGIIYSESVSGDLSNSGLTPTLVGPLAAGSNVVLGGTGRGASPDPDYFTLVVPVGFVLDHLTVLPGTTSGNLSFLGLQAGPQVTLSPTPADATGLLGWWHYSPADINRDILPLMAVPARGSSGFTPPLPAGQYSFWVQDTTPGSFTYALDFNLSPVPAPAGLVLLGLGLPAVGLVRRRKLA